MSEINKKSRGWLLTVFSNDGKSWNESNIDDVMKSHNWLWCGQLESGHETHHEHFQLYLEAANAVYGRSVSKAFNNAHVEPRHGSKLDAFLYCTKDDTRVDGPYFHGIDAAYIASSNQGHRSDLDKIRELVNDGLSMDDLYLKSMTDDDVARFLMHNADYVRSLVSARMRAVSKKRRDVKVSYIFGSPGIGKTSTVLDMYPDAYRITSYKHPFDSYDGQSTLILDEFSGADSVDFHDLMNMLDVYPYECQARYNNRVALWYRVFIISNLPPYQEVLYPGLSSHKWGGFERRINAGFYDFDNGIDFEKFKRGLLPDSENTADSITLSSVMRHVSENKNAVPFDYYDAIDDWLDDKNE